MAEYTVESDSVPQRKRRKTNKMAESAVESDSVPQLPLVVLSKVALMLQRNDGDESDGDDDESDDGEGWVFKDPLQLAAVSRQLRQAVLSSFQQMKRRHMEIKNYHKHIEVAGITVKNELRSAYTQMDCIDALLAFAPPNSLNIMWYYNKVLSSRDLILTRSLPLSLTKLIFQVVIVEIGVDSPLDQALKAVASKTNLETLQINVRCSNYSAARIHRKSKPFVPKDSPFNHLLTLKNLRTLHVDANAYLSPAQMADLVNRSQSTITHICCQTFSTKDRNKLFRAMSDVVRGNITGICGVELPSVQADQLQFFARLPNCATIHFDYHFDYVNRQQFDEFGDRLLDVCCTDDVHPGRTLECSVGLFQSDLQQYVEAGGKTPIEYARGDTVVRLSIGLFEMLKHKHKLCPFG